MERLTAAASAPCRLRPLRGLRKREPVLPHCPVQGEKAELLEKLLAQYNDGRRKTFCFLAVNLLELPELRAAMARAEGRAGFAGPWRRKSRARRTKGASL